MLSCLDNSSVISLTAVRPYLPKQNWTAFTLRLERISYILDTSLSQKFSLQIFAFSL